MKPVTQKILAVLLGGVIALALLGWIGDMLWDTLVPHSTVQPADFVVSQAKSGSRAAPREGSKRKMLAGAAVKGIPLANLDGLVAKSPTAKKHGNAASTGTNLPLATLPPATARPAATEPSP